MIKTLPKEIQAALSLLWKYSTDASLSRHTKEQSEELGYDCKGKSCWHATFAFEEALTLKEACEFIVENKTTGGSDEIQGM